MAVNEHRWAVRLRDRRGMTNDSDSASAAEYGDLQGFTLTGLRLDSRAG